MALSTAEIIKLKSSIEKAIEEAKESVVLDILEQLQDGVKASTEILKSTKIGFCLTGIKKHDNANDEIKAKIKTIVDSWKLQIDKEKAAKESTSSSKPLPPSTPSASKTSTSASSSTQRKSISTAATSAVIKRDQVSRVSSNNNSPPSTPASNTSSSNLKERSLDDDGVTLDSTGNGVRDNCIKMLYSATALGSSLDGEVILSKVKALELGVFQAHSSAVSTAYKTRIRVLFLNLKEKNNAELRESFADGLIKPEKLAVMTREEMMSSERKAETKKAMEENIAEARTAPNQQAETDQFICGKCRSRKCTYYQMQTRSADEPMTTFVTCTNCRNAWKFC